MTAANHMLAGAVVAVSIQHPLLVAPLAVISHFVLDAMPHFGVHSNDALKRNKHPLFRYMIVVDIAMTVALLALLPSILRGMVSWWVLLVGMVFAFLPDLIWVHRFVYEVRYKKERAPGWFARFHGKIQWGERSWGVIVEVVFFGVMGVLLGSMAV